MSSVLSIWKLTRFLDESGLLTVIEIEDGRLSCTQRVASTRVNCRWKMWTNIVAHRKVSATTPTSTALPPMATRRLTRTGLRFIQRYERVAISYSAHEPS